MGLVSSIGDYLSAPSELPLELYRSTHALPPFSQRDTADLGFTDTTWLTNLTKLSWWGHLANGMAGSTLSFASSSATKKLATTLLLQGATNKLPPLQRLGISFIGALTFYGINKAWNMHYNHEELGSFGDNVFNFALSWAMLYGTERLIKRFVPQEAALGTKLWKEFLVMTGWESGEGTFREGVHQARVGQWSALGLVGAALTPLTPEAMVNRAVFTGGMRLAGGATRLAGKVIKLPQVEQALKTTLHDLRQISPPQALLTGASILGTIALIAHPSTQSTGVALGIVFPALGLGRFRKRSGSQPVNTSLAIAGAYHVYETIHRGNMTNKQAWEAARKAIPIFLGTTYPLIPQNRHIAFHIGITNHAMGVRFLAALNALINAPAETPSSQHPRISLLGLGKSFKQVHEKSHASYGLDRGHVVDNLFTSLLCHIKARSALIDQLGDVPIDNVGFSMGGLATGGIKALTLIAKNKGGKLSAEDVATLPGFGMELPTINKVISHAIRHESRTIGVATPLDGVPHELLHSPHAWAVSALTGRAPVASFYPESVQNYWKALGVTNPWALFDALVFANNIPKYDIQNGRPVYVNGHTPEKPWESPGGIIGALQTAGHWALRTASNYPKDATHDLLVRAPSKFPEGVAVYVVHGPDHLSFLHSMRGGIATGIALARALGIEVNLRAESSIERIQ